MSSPCSPDETPTDPGPAYHRVERRDDRTEVYPTRRLFRRCLAITWLYALFTLPFHLLTAVMLVLSYDRPDARGPVAVYLLMLGIPLAALLFWIRSRDGQAERDAAFPLVIGRDGAVSYRGAAVAPPDEVVGVRVLCWSPWEGPDSYSVQLVSPAGTPTPLPWVLPVTWYLGSGQGYFGGWTDRAIAERLAADLSRALGLRLLAMDERKQDTPD